ncbi:hypothetical protein HXX76_001168 [Chlamydomonas incerta]|uniref:SHSP domain-containing protein n=1 Tax=Chlamydomonas incerta TaxID=51695 RepID=A0A835WBL9_CHLIN|nr:hypothetical protein HXX76_001168 [Chlamydomonas incerta]|eukprot:KAG2444415.1 hypothetical protein HXX76_001168 [Chlamydomonas incerta]
METVPQQGLLDFPGLPSPLLHDFAEMGTMDGTIDGLFDEMLPTAFLTKMVQVHPMHVQVYPDRYEVVAEVPGMAADDVQVEVMPNHMLKVAGARNTTFPAAPQHPPEVYESYNFERSFGLPSDADVRAVTAALDRGVLTITVPRMVVEQPTSRRVTVHTHPHTGAKKN